MGCPNPVPYPTIKEMESAIQEGIRAGCYYSYILSSIDRRIDETSEAVAYVSMQRERAEWTLVINPLLFTKILETHPGCNKEGLLRAILTHEFLHIAHDHFERSFVLKDRYSSEMLNIAADLAVNSTLEGQDMYLLQDIGGLFPNRPPFDFPYGLSMEQYLKLLSKESIDIRILNPILADYEKTLKKIQEYSDHSTQEGNRFCPSPKDIETTATGKLKNRVAKIIKEWEKQGLSNRFPGRNGGDLEWMMEWVFPKVSIPWKSLLKNSLMQSGSSNTHFRSYRRSHPRATGGILLKGKIPAKKEQIMILLDTSGSMEKKDYEQFMGVIKSLISVRRSFSIMQWDYKRQSDPIPVEKFMGPKTKPRFRGGRGTDMCKGVRDVAESFPQFTKVIVVTDGGTPYFTKKDPSPVPVIWLLTSKARFENADGKVIRLLPEWQPEQP